MYISSDSIAQKNFCYFFSKSLELMQAKTNGVETTSGNKLTYAECRPNLKTCLPQTIGSLIAKLLILTGKYKKSLRICA